MPYAVFENILNYSKVHHRLWVVVTGLWIASQPPTDFPFSLPTGVLHP